MFPYQYLLIPLVVGLLTQIIKLSIDHVKGNMRVENIFLSYGGMPSAHTAFCVSITTLMGITQGWRSPIFALGCVFSLIIMRDAVSFRNILGQYGRLLNILVAKLPRQEKKDLPRFAERVGHSLTEVLVGALWGAVATYLIYSVINLS